MMRLVKAGEMQEMDRMTIQELGIPGAVLMENAGSTAAKYFLEHFEPKSGSKVLILCGRGNNGGDGYVIARYLLQAGLDPTVIVLSKLSRISGDALIYLNVAKKIGIKIYEISEPNELGNKKGLFNNSDFIVDGIFGTGLNSDVRGFYRDVIKTINESKRPVMAIDIPSGINADDGKIMGIAVRSDLTVTFGFPKLGQIIFPGAGLVGRLIRVDIGIPDMVANRIPLIYSMTELDDFNGQFIQTNEDIHKGHRGHLLILAGSTGKTGAATLTALGALRAGAGLVTLGIPESLNPILESKLTEAMTFPLPDTGEGTLSLKAKNKIFELLKGKTALALGPGLSTHPETMSLVQKIVSTCALPMVIDADGLNALVGKLDVLAQNPGKKILTPHPGEMGRLTGLVNSEVQDDRAGTATKFVEENRCCLVLKGARSLIALPSGRVYVNPTGNAALSSGGSGDVLTGIIGGLLARGSAVGEAAVGGVYLHGLTADFISLDKGNTGILASELLTSIPELMVKLGQGLSHIITQLPHSDLCKTV